MRKHRRILLGLTAAAVGIAGWYWLGPTSPRATYEAYQRIRGAMPQTEVEAILGVPPAGFAEPQVRPFPAEEFLGARTGVRLPNGCAAWAVWESDRGKLVVVYLDADRRAQGKMFVDAQNPPESWLARVRRWLGW
jgi:hypothetical protein